jgi:predicted small integral membrane protein
MGWMLWNIHVGLVFIGIGVMMIALLLVDLLAGPNFERKGFLPMATQRGDRVFVSLIATFVIHLVWVTIFKDLTAWAAMGVSAPVAFTVMMWG